MRAGVLHAPYDLRVEEVREPEPASSDVIVEVLYNGLCGTDATEYSKGPMMVPLHRPHPGSGHVGPTVLGHEFIGNVVDAGAEARSWIGKKVASGAGVSCGSCGWCRKGRTNLCSSYYTLGLSTHGGLAERVRVPASTLVEVPDGCSDVDAALAQPLAVGLHGVDRAGIVAGDRVVVLGAGAIGSFVLAGLSDHDGPVVVVDVDEGRLDVARRLGATETHLIERGATLADLRDLVPDPVDVVVESSGAPGAAANALGLAARGGRVLLVGLVKTPQELVLSDVVLREVDITTTVAHVCGHDLPRALDLLTRSPLSTVIGVHEVPLGAVVPEGFDPLVAGTAGGKILVDPRHG
ncbi:MAG TPA: alcohol dehydrogenase catalytic domain-containing protein [Candidatus Nanopelagicales bacterium]|nr:alcohol dehydrogenase catalytic domain-containing protein [Candidatus Nanopelagicales bacterium]